MFLATKLSADQIAAYTTLKEAVDSVLSRSAFAVVKLANLLPSAADLASPDIPANTFE